jgi:hypothetical protein
MDDSYFDVSTKTVLLVAKHNADYNEWIFNLEEFLLQQICA